MRTTFAFALLIQLSSGTVGLVRHVSAFALIVTLS